VQGPGDEDARQVVVVRKRLHPQIVGRHAAGAQDPRHWAYWRRELEAYTSDLLPRGPGLRAPRCLAVEDDAIYLEEIVGDEPNAETAAHALASWQVRAGADVDRAWIGRDQLERRVAVSTLDWTEVRSAPRLESLWARRTELLHQLALLPKVLSHGDFSMGNLRMGDDDVVVALDWATLGMEPVGFDLAHLALSTGADPVPAYLATDVTALGGPKLVRDGYAASLALIGASRYHWMLSRGIEPPDWYVDFVWGHRPGLS
jgi:Phosphotransferase enzyme family